MRLVNIMRETGVARPGMKLREAFRICTGDGVPGIPYLDAGGTISGRFSIRETLHRTCIPDILVRYADLLGDAPELLDDPAGCLKIPEQHVRKLLDLSVEPFILERKAEVSPDTPVAKAVALMERHTTNYLFVTSNNGYRGIVTIWDIARRMLEIG